MKLKRKYLSYPLVLLGLLCMQYSFAQNIVPNHSFEENIDCPNNEGLLPLATPWFSPNAGSPDYFHLCGSGDAEVPTNAFGTQFPNNGEAYAGFYAYQADGKREYASVALDPPMEAGKQYCVSMHLSFSGSNGAVNELGALFTENEINQSNELIINATPQVINQSDAIDVAQEWVLIDGFFTADANYEYLTIGNFNVNTDLINTNPGEAFDSLAYYFLDNIYVGEVSELEEIEDVAICVGESTDLMASGGEAYEWINLAEPDLIVSEEEEITITANTSETWLVNVYNGSCQRTDTIAVNVAPIPSIEVEVQNACAGQLTYFYDLSTNVLPEATYAWDFSADGSIESDAYGGTAFLFNTAGPQSIELSIDNGGGCISTEIIEIIVEANCDACENPENLIPNPSFESLENCPNGLNDLAQLTAWYQPTNGTADVFHQCFDTNTANVSDNAGVPANTFGDQAAYSGNTYAGIYVAKQTENYREYIAAPLNEPLVEGNTYCISFNVSHADYTALVVDNIGAYFSDDIIMTSTQTNLGFEPQFNYEGGLIQEQEDWLRIEGSFVADGNHEWIAIGNFYNNDNTDIEELEDDDIIYSNFAYLYIDEVVLTPLADIEAPADLTICEGEELNIAINDDYCSYEWINTNDPSNILSESADLAMEDLAIGEYEYIIKVNNGICELTDTVQLNVVSPPEVGFVATPNCAGTVTLFEDISQNLEEGAIYEWDFESNGTVDANFVGSIGHVYTTSGIYTVTLNIINGGECQSTFMETIIVPENCNPCLPVNMLSNGGFEDFSSCPESQGELNASIGWFSPNENTPDYFDSCNEDDFVGIPDNYMGTEEANNGSAYAGITTFDGQAINAREYVATKLTEPMIVGEEYCMSLHVSLSEESDYATNQLGVLFLMDSLSLNNTSVLNSYQPQIMNVSGIMGQSAGWQLVTGSIVADQAYEYVVVGNFETDANTTILAVGGASPSGRAFYYVDDISVINFELDIEGDLNVCEGETAIISTSNNFCEFYWTSLDNPNAVVANGENLEVEISETTTYLLHARNDLCEIVRPVTVNVFNSENATAGEDIELCLGDSVELNANGGDSYIWVDNPDIENPTQANPIVSPEITTDYIVNIIDEETSCELTDTVRVWVLAYPTADAGDDLVLCEGEEAQLNASGGSFYEWQAADGLSDTDIANPIVNPTETTTYYVEVSNGNNCSDIDSVTVVVKSETVPVIEEDLFQAYCLSQGDIQVICLDLSYEGCEQLSLSIDQVENISITSNNCFNYTAASIVSDTLAVSVCTESLEPQCANATVVFNVNCDEPPSWIDENTGEVVEAIAIETNQNEAITVDLPLSSDPNDDDDLNITFAEANNGTVSFEDGEIIYTPFYNFVGSDEFIVTLCDSLPPIECTDLLVNVEVLPVCETTASLECVSYNQSEQICIEFECLSMGNITGVESQLNADIEITTPLCINYDAPNNFEGLDTLLIAGLGEFEIVDTIMAIISVGCSPALAENDTYQITNDMSLSLDILSNDYDLCEEGMIVLNDIISQPLNGMAELEEETILYIPDPTFVGFDTLVYETCNPCTPVAACDEAFVVIEVSAGSNTAPAADDVYIEIMQADSAEVCIPEFNPSEDNLILEVIESSPNGTEVFINEEATCLTYIPDVLFVGEDSLLVTLCDTLLACDTAWVYITVLDGLIAVDDNVTTINGEAIQIDILENDTYPDGDLLEVSVYLFPDHGQVVIGDTSLIYSPVPGYEGLDSLYYVICDPVFGCDTAVVYINNDYVVDAISDTGVTQLTQTLVLQVLANDIYPEGSIDSCGIVPETINAVNGTASMTDDCVLSFTPDWDFVEGEYDSLDYFICSDLYGCDTTTVYLFAEYTPVNPVMVNDTVYTSQDQAITSYPILNDFDPNGDPIFTSYVEDSITLGSIVLNNDGSITYTPPPGFVGVDEYIYVACNELYPILCSWGLVTVVVSEGGVVQPPNPEDCELFIPNAMSPNGDGKNDEFKMLNIQCPEYKQNTLLIFNRWGSKVYEQENYPSEGWWNGTWDNNGEELPEGTYYYVLKINDNGDTDPKDYPQGFIEVNR